MNSFGNGRLNLTGQTLHSKYINPIRLVNATQKTRTVINGNTISNNAIAKNIVLALKETRETSDDYVLAMVFVIIKPLIPYINEETGLKISNFVDTIIHTRKEAHKSLAGKNNAANNRHEDQIRFWEWIRDQVLPIVYIFLDSTIQRVKDWKHHTEMRNGIKPIPKPADQPTKETWRRAHELLKKNYKNQVNMLNNLRDAIEEIEQAGRVEWAEYQDAYMRVVSRPR
jgi:hypothetical protein